MPIDFNHIPDEPRKVFTFYASGDTKDIEAFIREVLTPNQYEGLLYQVYSTNLDCIPESSWEEAKTLLRRIEMSVENIKGLIDIKDEAKLKKAIQFAIDHNLTNTRSLIGFNEVEVDEIDAFIETIITKDLLAYPRFWSMVYHLPEDQQDECIAFFKQHAFNDHAYRCGYLLLAKHQQSEASRAATSQSKSFADLVYDFFEQYVVSDKPLSEVLYEISDSLNGLVFSDEVLKLLAEKSHDDVMRYLGFIHTHHAALIKNDDPADEYSAYTKYLKTYLGMSTDIIDDVYDFFHQADVPRTYFLRLCDFIKENGEAFSANWNTIKHFITTFEAYHTDPSYPLTLNSQHLKYIIKYTREDVDRLKSFIDDKIATGDTNARERLFHPEESYQDSKFESLLPLSFEQLQGCYDYVLTQDIGLYYTPSFSKLNASDYNRFIAFLENPPCELKHLKYFLKINPDHWAAVTDMLESLDHSNPLEFWLFSHLADMSDEKLVLLCAFVKQFNITDPIIVEGLAMIPSVRQWQRILELATPLFVDRYQSSDAKAKIMTRLYKLTVQEHRVDRAMPQAPGVVGQIFLSQKALAWIRQVEHVRVVSETFEKNVLAIIEDRRDAPNVRNFVRPDIDDFIHLMPNDDVHAPGRDQSTQTALDAFKTEYAYDTSNEANDYASFLAFLAQYPDLFTKLSAEYVLGLKAVNTNDAFAPLVCDQVITAYQLDLTTKGFIARIWHFINQGAFIDLLGHEMSGETLAQDRDNAKNSLIQSLANSFKEDGSIVCDQGKLQRIVVGVLQGRFKGISIDRPIFTKAQMKASVGQALTDFLTSQKEDVSAQRLRENVSSWLEANPRGFEGQHADEFKRLFMQDLDAYIDMTYCEDTHQGASMFHSGHGDHGASSNAKDHAL